MTGRDWNIRDYAWAAKMASEGHQVRRASWPAGQTFDMRKVTDADREARDWELAE